jgi:hypothetical protein
LDFTPTPEKLVPDLSLREELVVLARTLWREGYNDHLAGHVTCNLGDGTLLCNLWLLTWAEVRPHQVLRIDLAGRVVEGDWPVPLGIPLHLALHQLRTDVNWAVHHHHPLYGTVWADMGEIPPILDQSSSPGTVSSFSEAQPGQYTNVRSRSSSAASTPGTYARPAAKPSPSCRGSSSTTLPPATAKASSGSGKQPSAPSCAPTLNSSTELGHRRISAPLNRRDVGRRVRPVSATWSADVRFAKAEHGCRPGLDGVGLTASRDQCSATGGLVNAEVAQARRSVTRLGGRAVVPLPPM